MNDPFSRLPLVPSFHCDQHRRHRWPGAASGTDVRHLRGFGRQGPLAPAVVVRRSRGNRELHRDHVRPRCAQRIRLLALGRRRYPRLGDRTPDRSGDGTGEHLPAGAFHLPNDARLARFIGAGPPPGDGRHRYVIVVQAIGIDKVGQLPLRVQADSTPAWLGFSINISGQLLGRAVITPWAETAAA